MKKRTPAKLREPEIALSATFDLRDEPWIPVIRKDGTPGELSLREVLMEAPKLREIRDPLPTVEFGLHRLLVALVLDIFELSSANDLESLLDAGEFDAKLVEEYCDRWHDRFDLFHPKSPFLQSPGMKDEKPKPLTGLIHPLPSGTNANHFHHGDERLFGVCPAAAARLLTTIAPFMTAGGAGLSPSINGAPPWYVLLRGPTPTVFETLCLNGPVVSDLVRHADGDEPPAWRAARAVSAKRQTGASLCESLTWQPRRIQLLRDAPGRCALTGRESPVLVREMKFSAGFAAGFEWTDPNVPYRIGDDERNVLRPREGRAVWRDTGPVALLRDREYQSEANKIRFDRPAIVSQFALLHEQQMLRDSAPLDLVIFGMRTDMKKKVFEWHREQLSLPAPLVLRTQFHSRAQEEMHRAESTAYALKQAIRRAYPRDGAGNKAAFDALIARAQTDFWNSLRPQYEMFLRELAELPEEDDSGLPKLLERWRGAIRECAEAALRDAIEDLDTDADALERQTVALRAFAGALFGLLNPGAAAKAKVHECLFDERSSFSPLHRRECLENPAGQLLLYSHDRRNLKQLHVNDLGLEVAFGARVAAVVRFEQSDKRAVQDWDEGLGLDVFESRLGNYIVQIAITNQPLRVFPTDVAILLRLGPERKSSRATRQIVPEPPCGARAALRHRSRL